MKLLLVIFIGVFASTVEAVITENQIVDIEAIQENIESRGAASVIIEYDSLVMSSDALNSLSGDDLSVAISSMRTGFVSSLSQGLQDSIQMQYDFIPGVVATVNQAELEELRQNPLVRNVSENKLNKSHLGESLGLVYRNKASAGFDGGDGWTVAVLDTGVEKSHNFLKKNNKTKVVSEACYSGGNYNTAIYLEVKRLCPGNAAATTATGSGTDCSGYDGCDHGTHVAGIAAGNDGVASGANIIAIQVFTGFKDAFGYDPCDNGGGSCIGSFDSDIIAGLNRVYALRNQYNIAAVNMSLGGGYYTSGCNNESSLMTNIISKLKSAGIATVVSSGNDYRSYGISFPACITNSIAVGATADFTGSVLGNTIDVELDERVAYSNNSKQLDIYAPGSLIRSSVPNNKYAKFNGTSMAAPHVAGAFAVLKQGMPNASVANLESILKSVGPKVQHAGVTRRRLDILSALKELGIYSTNVAPIMQLLILEEE